MWGGYFQWTMQSEPDVCDLAGRGHWMQTFETNIFAHRCDACETAPGRCYHTLRTKYKFIPITSSGCSDSHQAVKHDSRESRSGIKLNHRCHQTHCDNHRVFGTSVSAHIKEHLWVLWLLDFSIFRIFFMGEHPRRCKTSSVGQSAGLSQGRRFDSSKNSENRELKSTWIWAT